MGRTARTVKKHLNFDALHQSFSKHLLNIDDHRQTGRCNHSLHDSVMSAFACMYFQEPSLVEFQRQREKYNNWNNLRTLFGVQSIPKDSQLRDIIDQIDSENFRPVFKDYFSRLRRAKYLEDYQLVPRHYICSIDGVYYHSSEKIHCSKCLSKKHKNGTVTYHHGVLQGAFMHPEKKQIIPVMPEPIANSDGYKKQDCEINAAKRFISQLKKDHPRLAIIINGDGLFSKAPMIDLVQSHGMHFLFVAKPADHRYMMEWLAAFESLPQVLCTDSKGRQHRFRYCLDVPLNASEDAPRVNYIAYEIVDPSKGKVVFHSSWVTDMLVNDETVVALAKGGRCRWKIENECFNTLKNQGYHLDHNFGHGKQHLSHNLYLLTLLAFFFHQVFELSDPVYQACRRALYTKAYMWKKFRALIDFFQFNSWNNLMRRLMRDRGDISAFEKH